MGSAQSGSENIGASTNDVKPDFPKPDTSEEADISDDRVDLPQIDTEDLPRCPQCSSGLLRPGVVWFGEPLPSKTLKEIDSFIEEPKKIDLILVIGTSAKVYVAISMSEDLEKE